LLAPPFSAPPVSKSANNPGLLRPPKFEREEREKKLPSRQAAETALRPGKIPLFPLLSLSPYYTDRKGGLSEALRF